MNDAVMARPSGVPRKGRFRSVGTGPGAMARTLSAPYSDARWYVSVTRPPFATA